MRKLLSDKETADYTGLSLWSINELRRRGQIPYIKLPGIRKYFYDQSVIDKWLEGLQNEKEPSYR